MGEDRENARSSPADREACPFLGAQVGRVKVRCPRLGAATAYNPLHACDHPDRDHAFCVPGWPGPWMLPLQAFEERTIAICEACDLMDKPAICGD